MNITSILNEYKKSYRRRADLSILAITSFIIAIPLYPSFLRVGQKLVNRTSHLHWSATLAVLTLISSALWLLLIRTGVCRFKRDIWDKVLLKHPPLWITVFVTALAYLYLMPFMDQRQSDVTQSSQVILMYSTAVFLVGGAIIAAVADNFLPVKNVISYNPTIALKNINALIENPEKLVAWLQNEKAIQTPQEDAFGHAAFARRIARILREPKFKTIGLLGSYGCGKSSVIGIIEHYLRNPNELEQYLDNDSKALFDSRSIITCKIGGWGLRTGIASEHILKEAIGKLSEHIDSISLMTIPANYRAAIVDDSTTWGKIVGILFYFSEHNPGEILVRIDRLLGSTNKRLIIYLEDLDRNTIEGVFYDEIAALLDRLKELNNISFVLAIEQEANSMMVLHRILEHIETIPSLPRKESLALLNAFRKACISQFKEEVDCLTLDERAERTGMYDAGDTIAIGLRKPSDLREPIDAIVPLIGTPRLMKKAFHQTWQTWQSLHGELDFDDILVVNVLRYGAPEAFAFLYQNIDFLRPLGDRSLFPDINNEEKIRMELNSSWETLVKDVAWDHAAAKYLIDYLVGGWIKDSSYRKYTPQGIHHLYPTNYFVRLNAEEIDRNELRDQIVLKALYDWKKDRAANVCGGYSLPMAILKIPNFAVKVNQFGDILDAEEIRYLAQDLFALHLKEDISAKDGSFYPGFLELMGLALRKPWEQHTRWLMGEIDKALIYNLKFAYFLYSYWSYEEREVRKEFIDKLKQTYANYPDLLIKTLDPKDPHTIRSIVIIQNADDGYGNEYYPEEWEWLGNVFLATGEKNPQIIIPEIVSLLTEYEPMKRKFILIDARAEAIFKDQVDRLMSLLATDIDVDYNREAIKYTREEARKWLAGHRKE